MLYPLSRISTRKHSGDRLTEEEKMSGRNPNVRCCWLLDSPLKLKNINKSLTSPCHQNQECAVEKMQRGIPPRVCIIVKTCRQLTNLKRQEHNKQTNKQTNKKRSRIKSFVLFKAG